MGAKILVVDDNEVVLQVVRVQLEARGFAVATSDSVQGGFEHFAGALREGSPLALLVVDLEMPEDRGTVLIRAVRELEDQDGVAPEDRLPILLLTGVDLSTVSPGDHDDLLTLDVSYLPKEDTDARLVPTVERMLRQHRRR